VILFNLILFVAVCSAYLAGYAVAKRHGKRELAEREQELLEAKSRTPIKELVKEFRGFVESVDGAVSPEVEGALQRLEGEAAAKALPPASSKKENTENEKEEDWCEEGDWWSAFVTDMNFSADSSYRIELLERWLERGFEFTLKRQIEFLASFKDDYYREQVRDLFDEYCPVRPPKKQQKGKKR
jgi:hypothetical protein